MNSKVTPSKLLRSFPGVALIAAGLAGTSFAQSNYATPYAISAIAGQTTAGSANGTGTGAQFNVPSGIAIDGSGNMYIADTGNDTIRVITPAGVVSTLAGTPGVPGSTNATGAAALFNGPNRLAVDASGNVYVADTQNHLIRKITPGGVVSTLAGTAGVIGSTDGPGATALFHFPEGVAVDGSGNVYVADTYNNTIRMITPAGVVSTLAGTASTVGGSSDGTGAAAQFALPIGIAVDGSGNLYVADSGNYLIRKITPGAVVTTLAGTVGVTGSADGIGTAAQFFTPEGITVDGSGNVYVTDRHNDTIRFITPVGVVTTLAGIPGVVGTANLTGAAALFNQPNGIAVDASQNIYIADTHNNLIRFGIAAQAPVILAQPASQGNIAGASVVLSVSATGVDTFQWDFNGAPIEGATSSTLALPSFSSAQVGVYSVVVTNAFGSTISAPATVEFDPSSYAGAYFGSIVSGGGTWALYVNPNQTGVFIAYLTGSDNAMVANVSVNATGNFSASGTSLLSGPVERRAQAASAPAAFSLSGRISFNYLVSGSVSGVGNFSGQADPGGPSNAFQGLYQETGLYSAPGSATTIIGGSGESLTVIVSPSAADYALGTVEPNGQMSAVTILGAAFLLSADGTSGSITITETPAGSAPIYFGGVSGAAAPSSRLKNISVRCFDGVGSQIMIGGFVVGGSGTQGSLPVLVRGLGPALATFGVTDWLADPYLSLNQGNQTIGTNANWAANAAQITSVDSAVGAIQLTNTSSMDAALYVPGLSPGAYTLEVSGKTGDTGVALAEVYDASTAASETATTPRLVNISARANVGTGNNVVIAGFVIEGNASETVLIRAVGPGLSAFGVSGVLSNPNLQLHAYINGQDTVVASNSGWGGTTALSTAFAQVGAFGLASGSADAAILITLAPGIYTAVVSGNAGTTGIALVEVYEVD
jgi:sugar lactone lactonase YvrE